MNCQEFESNVTALVDEKLIDASQRKHAFAHAATCERCVARLADERVMARGLQALAEDTKEAQPRPQLKAALRAAFDEQAAAAVTKPVVASNVIPMRPRRQQRFSFTQPWALAAAASLLAMFALGIALWLRSDSTPNSQIVIVPKQTPTATPAPARVEEAPAPKRNTLALNNQTSVAQPKASRPQAARNVTRSNRSRDAAKLAPVTNAETANEYIALNNATQNDDAENSIVVRVKVARASLLAMGLPLNGEKAEGMVSADLKVDMNGTPLAIRLLE